MRAGLVAILALAVGLAVGYLFGASRDAPPARGTSSRPADPVAEEQPPEVRPTGDSTLARALRDLPVPSVERGNGTITGRATRPDGTPVFGLTVRANLQRPDSWRENADGPPPPPDIEEEVRKLVTRLQRDQLGQREATTDRDGRYQLSGLVDGTYGVYGYLAGYRVTPARDSQPWQARPGSTVDFTAEPVTEVAFDVLLPDGSSPEEAMIQLNRANSGTGHTWRRDQPRILVTPGDYGCTATAGQQNDYRSDEVRLQVTEGAPAPPTVTLTLKGRPGIRGTVSFAAGFPFQNVMVRALAFSGDKQPDLARLAADGKSAWSRSGSRYEIPDLPKGRYLVGAGPDQRILATRVVEVKDRMETCDLVIDALDPSLYVIVRVLDPAGKPLTDVSFTTGYRTANSSSSGGSAFAKREDGSYLVLHHSHDREEGGTYDLYVSASAYGTKQVSYKKGEATEIAVRFENPATLEVVVAGFASSDQAQVLGVSLTRVATEGRNRSGENKTPDAEGRLSFGPVEPGDYDVTLVVRSGRHETLPAGSRRVTLVAGKNAVSLPMPRLQSLTVTDPDGKPGQYLQLVAESGIGWSQIRVRLDEQRRGVFPAVPEGRYQIRREGGRSDGAMRVTVPGPTEIVLRVTPYTALRVTVTEATGAWAKAGFETGDLIVAIDGDEIDSFEETRTVYNVLMTKDKASLSILRGGGRVALTVNPKELFSGESRGGRIEWATR